MSKATNNKQRFCFRFIVCSHIKDSLSNSTKIYNGSWFCETAWSRSSLVTRGTQQQKWRPHRQEALIASGVLPLIVQIHGIKIQQWHFFLFLRIPNCNFYGLLLEILCSAIGIIQWIAYPYRKVRSDRFYRKVDLPLLNLLSSSLVSVCRIFQLAYFRKILSVIQLEHWHGTKKD